MCHDWSDDSRSDVAVVSRPLEKFSLNGLTVGLFLIQTSYRPDITVPVHWA